MTTLRRSLRLLPALALAVAGLAACGDDSSTAGDSTPTTPTTSSSTADAGSGSGGGSGSGADTGTGTATGAITITAKDFSFDKAAITAPAGMVTITLDNMGKATHEFVLLKTDADPTSLKVGSDGTVDESDSVGEVSETDGGQSASHTFDLKPGKYVFVCNIPGHYQDGMAGELTVS